MTTRRGFLLASMSAALLPELALASVPELRLLSPANRGSLHFTASLDGKNEHESPIPMRGHGLEIDPRNPHEALIIERRPGTRAVKVDLRSGTVLHIWQAKEDRHFYGHAVYSRDGRTVFTTECDAESGKGLLSVRDADTFRVQAEYATHGIGPHELILLQDGVTLAVANGGIQTFPETGRVKLNRGRIEASLVYIDSRDGKLLGKYVVASTQLSLRHLVQAPDGRIAAALQFEGSKRESGMPLLVFHRGEDALQFAPASAADWDKMRQYAASVAYDPKSQRYALTCPYGSTLACWTANGDYAGQIAIPNVYGVAFKNGQGYASNDLGEIYRLDLAKMDAQLHAKFDGLEWDNHLYTT